jgi:hypothetical protein
MELRVVEGFLSLWGLEGIDIDNPAQSWHPDTEEEKEKLHITSFANSFHQLADSELSPTPFDVIAKSFIAAWDAREIEVPLSFFRKGRIDCRGRRYIEAFYDYYFVLETVYADGKTKNSAVKEAMKRNCAFLGLIDEALSDDIFLASILEKPVLKTGFEKKYSNKSAAAVIDALVETRGFLHHHNSKRPGIWHPEEHSRFELDSLVIEAIAFRVVFTLAKPFMFSDRTVDGYHKSVRMSQKRSG